MLKAILTEENVNGGKCSPKLVCSPLTKMGDSRKLDSSCHNVKLPSESVL